MYELFVKSAQIGWCPLWFRIYASSEHGRTLFAPTDVCGVIKGCEINNNAKCQGGWAVEGASPYRLLGKVRCAAKSLRSLRIYICSGRGWAVQILCSDMGFVWYMALVCFLHFNLHLVGLRRMRLCLKLRSGLCPKNPQGTLSLDPASPLTPGLSLRFISRSARCCLLLHIWAQLCSALPIPHSSLLIPHLKRSGAGK